MKSVAAVRHEGIELGQSAIDEIVDASVEVDGMSQRIAYLRVSDLADAVVELQAVAYDVVQNAAIERDGGIRLIGLHLFRVFTDDAEERAVQVAVSQHVAKAAMMDDDALPTAWRVVIEKVVEHVVHPVASQNDGLLQGAFHQ